MKLLRTIPWFTRLLVGLFLAVQFAGMVSSPRANALPLRAAASQMDAIRADAPMAHHHAAQGHGGHGMPCGDHGNGDPANTCCALHACFAGLLPPVISIAAEIVAGEPLCAGPDDLVRIATGGRLDRPPRSLH